MVMASPEELARRRSALRVRADVQVVEPIVWPEAAGQLAAGSAPDLCPLGEQTAVAVERGRHLQRVLGERAEHVERRGVVVAERVGGRDRQQPRLEVPSLREDLMAVLADLDRDASDRLLVAEDQGRGAVL